MEDAPPLREEEDEEVATYPVSSLSSDSESTEEVDGLNSGVRSVEIERREASVLEETRGRGRGEELVEPDLDGSNVSEDEVFRPA